MTTSLFDISEEELPIFRAESEEQLQALEEGLVDLERQTADPDLIQAIFRAAHTLKGSAGMIGHKRMVALTHSLETVLDCLRKGQIIASAGMIDACLESLDCLGHLVEEVWTGQESNVEIEKVIQNLKDFSTVQEASLTSTPISSTNQNATSEVEDSGYKIYAQISAESIAPAARAFQLFLALQEAGKILSMQPELETIEKSEPVFEFHAHLIPDKSLEEIKKSLQSISEIDQLSINGKPLCSPVPETKPAPTEDNSNTPRMPLGKLLVVRGLISQAQLQEALIQQSTGGPAATLGQILVRMGWVSQEVLDEIIIEQGQQKKISPKSPETENAEHQRQRALDKTVRTSVGRLDNLMNLIGELITDRNRMYQLRRDLEIQYRGSPQVEALSETVTHIGRITDNLQTEVMGIRMLPISNVFSKFPRLVRDLARKADKQIDLVLRGEDTELDRSVIEVISDPLIHLIRNAVDHGIETPQERIQAGKPERGILLLTARHEQGRILITIEDNGKGIDVQKVKAKAVEKGQISQAEADSLTDEEAIDLIFVSGLSTARVVSDVSGRGVGMDIVRNNIERLNGNILVESWPGRGTQFTVVLPLTLAIVPTLLVNIGNATHAIPLVMVSETLRIKKEDIKSINNKPVILLREHVLPVQRLSELFNVAGATNGHEKIYEYVVVVRSGKSQMGLIVDNLIGEQEVVVKSLSSVIGEIPGISSAAILGDGKVALIIDVQGLFKLVSLINEDTLVKEG